MNIQTHLNADDTEVLSNIDLRRAIRRLHPRQQAVLALRYSGYPRRLITSLLGISRTTVWADEREAVNNLQRILFVGSAEDNNE